MFVYICPIFILFVYRFVYRSSEKMSGDRDIVKDKHTEIHGADRRFSKEIVQP